MKFYHILIEMKKYIRIIAFAIFTFHGVSTSQSKVTDWLDSGKKKYALQDYKGAITDFTKFIKQHPKSWQAFYWRGRAYDYAGVDGDILGITTVQLL
jgi:hypothetical protein